MSLSLSLSVTEAAPRPLDFRDDDGGTIHARLSNGLRVVLRNVPGGHLTSFFLRVNTGSIHEKDWYGYGLSHFFEHSLFLGSERRPKKDQFSAEIEGYGGANVNAYTTFDHTAYHFTLLAEHSLKGLDAMEDLVFHPLFPPADVSNEMGSIQSEMDMRGDQVDSAFHEFLMRVSFRKVPYRFPVIGFKERFRTLRREDLLAYYRDRYVPSNMILSVVGSFDSAAMLAEVQKLYGRHPAKAAASFRFAAEEPFSGGVYETTHPKARAGRISWLWRSVNDLHPDMYALDVLAAILAHGKGTVLVDRLKEKTGLVESVSASSWTPREGGVFEIGVQLPTLPDRSSLKSRTLEIEKILLEEIGKIANGDFEAWRLPAIQRELLVGLVEGKESTMGQAGGLASSVASLGGINADALYFEGIQAVTAEAVAKAARAYLLAARHETAVLVPAALSKGEALFPGAVFASGLGEAPVRLSPADPSAPSAKVRGLPVPFEAALMTSGQGGSARGDLRPETLTLPNGLKVLYAPSSALPAAHAVWASQGGLAWEENDTANGSFALLSRLFFAGTTALPKEKLLRELRIHGIDMDPFSGKNSAGVQFHFLRDKVGEASDLLRQVVTDGAKNEADFTVEKRSQRFSVETRKEDGWAVSTEDFRRNFFKGTPLARMENGSLESVDALTPEALRRLHERTFVASNSVLAVFGDVTRDELERNFLSWARALPAKPAPARVAPRLAPLQFTSPADMVTATLAGSRQTFFRLAFRAPSMAHEDREAFQVLAGHLSGMGGPLFKLRSEPFAGSTDGGGRAYSLGGFYEAGLDYGALVLYAALRYDARHETNWAIESFRKETETLRSATLGAAELRRAKSAVLGSSLQSSERLGNVAFEKALYELYGIGHRAYEARLDRLQNVTAADVRRVAERYLGATNFFVHALLPEH